MEIRPARMSDAESLFRWRNDDLTRAMSRNSDQIVWQDHLNWLENRLSKPEPSLFIAEIDGVAVGTFRVDGDEISYTVSPDHRRIGLGLKMLRKAREILGPLRAEIFARNATSINIARQAGFRVMILD